MSFFPEYKFNFWHRGEYSYGKSDVSSMDTGRRCLSGSVGQINLTSPPPPPPPLPFLMTDYFTPSPTSTDQFIRHVFSCKPQNLPNRSLVATRPEATAERLRRMRVSESESGAGLVHVGLWHTGRVISGGKHNLQLSLRS